MTAIKGQNITIIDKSLYLTLIKTL
jgi:hypothetical protein